MSQSETRTTRKDAAKVVAGHRANLLERMANAIVAASDDFKSAYPARGEELLLHYDQALSVANNTLCRLRVPDPLVETRVVEIAETESGLERDVNEWIDAHPKARPLSTSVSSQGEQRSCLLMYEAVVEVPTDEASA